MYNEEIAYNKGYRINNSGDIVNPNGASMSASKYDKDFVDTLRKDKDNGLTYKELMKKYNISSKGTISFLINKRTLFK